MVAYLLSFEGVTSPRKFWKMMPGVPIFSIFKSVFGPIEQYLPVLWLCLTVLLLKSSILFIIYYLCRAAYLAEKVARTWMPTNGPYVNFWYWTGTSMQLRLMQGVFSDANDINLFLMIFNDIPPHESPLHASSSPIQRIWIWSILTRTIYRRIPKVTAPVTFKFCWQKGPLLLGSR